MAVIAKGHITIINLNDGKKGTGIASTVSQYYLSTSPTSMTGGSWSTTVPTPAAKSSSVWEREVETYTDGSVQYGTPRCVSSLIASYSQSIVDDELTAVANAQSTNALSGKISNMTTNIQQNASKISSLVTKTDNIDGIVSTHTSAISQLPSTIDARITTQVSSGGSIYTAVAAAFTMSGNGLSLFGKTIQLTGATIFSSLASKTDAQGYASSARDAAISAAGTIAQGKASEAVENIQPGCRNLLLRSNVAATLQAYGMGGYNYSEEVSNGEEYTLVVCARMGTNNTELGAYFDGGTGGDHANFTCSKTGFEVVTLKHTIANKLRLKFYQFPNGTFGSEIKWACLYKGNKAPKVWQPATEDVALMLGYNSYEDMASMATIIDGGHIRTSLIDADAIVTKALVTSVLSAQDATISDLTVSQATISQCDISQCTVSGELSCGNATFSNGTFVNMTATNGTFTNCNINGTLNGVSGSFVELYTVDASGNRTATISFGDGISFDGCDMYNGAGHRFFANDIFCRNQFGAAERTSIVITNSTCVAYADGLSESTRHVTITLTTKTTSGGSYMVIPCFSPGYTTGYNYGTNNPTAGMPVDTVIINSSSSYTYVLDLFMSQRVTVVNANDNISVYLYLNGAIKEIKGGAAAVIQNIGNHMTPAPSSGTIGMYQIFLSYYDNNF